MTFPLIFIDKSGKLLQKLDSWSSKFPHMPGIGDSVLLSLIESHPSPGVLPVKVTGTIEHILWNAAEGKVTEAVITLRIHK